KPEDRFESAGQLAAQLDAFRPAGGSRPTERRPAPSARVATAPTAPMHTPAGRAVGASTPHRSDTIGLVERAMEKPRVSTKIAIVVVLGLSLLAGIATYLIRQSVVPEAPAPLEALTGEPAALGAP